MTSQPILRQADLHALFREAAPTFDGRHPDLHECLRAHGTAHSTGGRTLPRRLAVLSRDQQEARLAEPSGWTHRVTTTPAPLAVSGARSFNASHGMADPHSPSFDYSSIMQTPDVIRNTGRAYDNLPDFDPRAVPSYDAMAREVNDQYNHLVNNVGIKPEFVDYDPYPDVHHLINDVNQNKRLKVLNTASTGHHPYFSDDQNDRFRFVHDLFGHAATGRSFDRHGEQAAFLAHSRMFSPQARAALASETKGQNSSLILNGNFPRQKVALLPEYQQQPKAASRDAYSTSAYADALLKEAIPEHLDRRYKEKLMDHLVQQYEKNEPMGYTLHDQLGDAPTSGYMVSYPPDKGQNKGIPLSDVTAEDLGHFAEDNRNKINSSPDNFLGSWVEDDDRDPYGMLYNDVSENEGNDWDALGKALDRNQIAVMDNDKVDHKGKPLDSAFNYTSPWANSGLAGATGFTQAKRRSWVQKRGGSAPPSHRSAGTTPVPLMRRGAENKALQQILATVSDADYLTHHHDVTQKIDQAIKNGMATHQLHKGTHAGYSPERFTQQRQMVEDAWNKLAKDIPRNRQGMLMGGLPGSGKSTVFNKLNFPDVGPANKNFMRIDPDYFKEEMARRGMVPQVEGLSPMEAAPLIHQESSDLAARLAKRAVRHGVNLAYDGTLTKPESGRNKLDNLRRHGYQTRGVFVDLPVADSVQRAEDRHRKGYDQYLEGKNPLGGRLVPPSFITNSAPTSPQYSSKNRENFEKLRPLFSLGGQVFPGTGWS